MARDRDDQPSNPADPTNQADPAVVAAAAAAMTTVTGAAPVPPEPEQIDKGRTLVRTRPGYAFQGSTLDVPVTAIGVLVTAEQAAEIQKEAAEHGEVILVGADDNNQEG